MLNPAEAYAGFVCGRTLPVCIHCCCCCCSLDCGLGVVCSVPKAADGGVGLIGDGDPMGLMPVWPAAMLWRGSKPDCAGLVDGIE